jgi:hypothetical protein
MTGKILTLVFLGFTALSISGCVVDNSTPACANPLLVSWSIDDGVNQLTCADVGAGWVRVSAAGFTDYFPCEALLGQTGDEPGGNYTITIDLLTPSRAQVLSSDSEVFSVPTCGGGDLGHIAFLVN